MEADESSRELSAALWRQAEEEGPEEVSSPRVFWELLLNVSKVILQLQVTAATFVHLSAAPPSPVVCCTTVCGLSPAALSSASPSKAVCTSTPLRIPLPVSAVLSPSLPYSFTPAGSDGWASAECRVEVRVDQEREQERGRVPSRVLQEETRALTEGVSLWCRFCRATLHPEQEGAVALTKAMEMPSEHWVELSELWVCHRETFSHFPKRDLTPSPGHCLVSPTALHLHRSSLPSLLPSSSSSSSPASSSSFSKQEVLCPQCHVRIGIFTGDDSLQLFKHAILSSSPSSTSSSSTSSFLLEQDLPPSVELFQRDTVEMRLAGQIYASCLARLAYHFNVVASEMSSSVLLQIRVLCATQTSLSEEHRFVKVLFKRPQNARLEACSLLSSQKTEAFSFPFDDVVALLTALVVSSRQLPLSRRSFQPDWTIGYLRLPLAFRH